MTNNEVILLDREQKKAVEYNRGPLLIVAGAGTGKTFVIVEKIKHLIKKKLAKPEEILALTFTEKASAEMEERVDKNIPYGYFQTWISTFHAFADQILKEEFSHIGLTPGYRLMSEAESIIFLRQNLFTLNLKYFQPLGNPNKFLSAILQHFSRLQEEDISPDQYLRWINSIKKLEEKNEVKKYLELAHAYQAHQQLKTKYGVMDFSDLVYYLLKLFRQRPNILKKYQQQFKYFLVDEFQDTNIGQFMLIKLLCPPSSKPKLTVVGDDSQSIYKFRGASISNILDFMKEYPDAKQITLSNNYRSNQTILDAAYQLIQHNNPDTLESKLGISKKLIAKKSNNPQAVQFHIADRVENEAEQVANTIINLKSKYSFSDFSILVRANNHAAPFIRALTRLGIPYQFLGPGMLYKQPEVKDLIAYLEVLYNLDDSTAFYRMLVMNIFDLDNKDIHLLLAFAKKTNLSLFTAINIWLSFYYPDLYLDEYFIYKKYLPLTAQATKEKLLKIIMMVKKHLKKVKTHSAGQILYWFLEDTGFLNKLTNFKTEAEEKVVLNVSKFFDKLKSYESSHEDASIFAVVDYIQMSLELGESPLISQTDISLYNAVNIITVHSAKGLEFPVVFLVNLSRGRFPTYEKKEAIPIPQALIKEILPRGNFHEQEERRLFYVGITRAIDRVFVSASNYYGEGKNERKISPFVVECFGKSKLEKLLALKREEKIQLSIFDFKPLEQKQSKNTQKKLEINQLSYSQLSVYSTCPLQYKYQYQLRIPTLPSAAESFGTTIHQTLESFYKEYLTNKKISQKSLLNIYKINWSPIGYSSAIHEQRMKTEGKKMLSGYFKKFHSKNLKILSLERYFKVKIKNNLFLIGKIDRVDQLSNGQIEIIDYKTGKKPGDKKIDKNIQLSIYALAASDRGLFNKELSNINLSYYYLSDLSKITLKKTHTDLLIVKEKIIDIVSEIQKSSFIPKVGPWCNFCSYKIICEAWQ